MPKIKILHIIKSLGRGGAEMLLQETLRYHDQTKFEFHYIYFLPWKNQMVSGIEKEGGIVVNMSANNNWQIIGMTGEVIDYVRANHIDIIHCHLPWAGFLGRRVFAKTGIPVIYTEHNKQERYHFATRLLNRLSFNKQSLAIAVSDNVAESIKKNIKPRIPVRTVLNGVDTEKFKRDADLGRSIRKKYGIPEDAVLLGNIAVFRFQKRLKEWVDLLKEVQDKNPHVYGCIVGAGILEEEVKAHIKSRGMEDRIILPGLQTDVLPWLSAMDVFVMTSEFEGLPIALLEAMSMECAVVCTNAGGIGEVIRDRQDGFLFPVTEWRNMETVITQLASDKNEIRTWGQKARQRIESSFSIRSMVNETESIYESFVSNKS